MKDSLFKILFIFSFIVSLFVAGIFFIKQNQNKNKISKETISTNSKILNTPTVETREGTVEVTEKQIETIISDNISEITDPKVKIGQENIAVSGKVKTLFNADLALKTRPVIKNDKVVIEVSEAKIGFIIAPENLIEKVLLISNKKIEEAIGNKRVTSLQLTEGKIIIKTKE